MSRKGMTAEQARALLDEQAQSGQTIKEFARLRGLTPSALYAWNKRFAAPAKLVRVRVKQAPTSSRATCTLEVVMRAGHVVRVAHDFDEAVLMRLVRALESGA